MQVYISQNIYPKNKKDYRVNTSANISQALLQKEESNTVYEYVSVRKCCKWESQSQREKFKIKTNH